MSVSALRVHEQRDTDQIEAMCELIVAQERTHRRDLARLTSQIMAHRAALESAGLDVPDSTEAELALNQFHRMRNALERVYIWFDGDVPSELRSSFSGTILT